MLKYFHMKLVLLLLLITTTCVAQNDLPVASLAKLRAYEDTLRQLGDTLVHGSQEVKRKEAGYSFIKKLVKALQVPGSYDYRFDSVQTINVIYSPDKKFRIFNWQLMMDNGTYRYYGAIQKNNKKKLELYPLFDKSDFIKNPEDSILNKDNWYGGLYYNLVLNKHWGKRIYTLFAWDGNNLKSTKKFMDVLTFDKEGMPVFGAPVFKFDTNKDNYKTRHILEYGKNTGVTFNYKPELKMVIFDHLVPQGNPADRSKYIVDGTYEGFKFKGGKWVYIEKVFNQVFATPPGPNQ